MELLKALGALAEPPEHEHRRLIEILGLPAQPDRATHHHLFLQQLYPYASVYLGAEGMMGGEARERVAGFWRALGSAAPEEPDHLCALLALYASLAEEGAGRADPAEWALAERARGALLHEHVTSWAFVYLADVRRLGGPFYAAWAELLEEALIEALDGANVPEGLPVHLREAPPLPDPRAEGGEAFLSGLLAPVRCGMILTRTHLAEAARGLGLGLRIGERMYVLKALLSQDPAAVLEWLVRLARDVAARHEAGGARRTVDSARVTSAFWAERAMSTALLCQDLLADRPEWEEPSVRPAAASERVTKTR